MYKQSAIQCLKSEAEAILALIPRIDDSFHQAVSFLMIIFLHGLKQLNA